MYPSKRTSPNGKLRILPFLRGLLNDGNHCDIIIWTNEATQEFQMLKPHKVAELWGVSTGNPSMNYDKMSRSLRYFYGDSSDNNKNKKIEKMPGKNSAYRFLEDSASSSPDQTIMDVSMIKTEMKPLTNFKISNFITTTVPGNNSLSNSPTSSTSSAGSTSPIAPTSGGLITPFPLVNPLGLLPPHHLAVLVQNPLQFYKFIAKFPILRNLQFSSQVEIYCSNLLQFPTLFPID